MDDIVLFLTNINDNLTKVFNETIRKDVSNQQLLYHYTTVDALLSIISQQTFWFSSVELMNDKNEVDYSLSIIEKALIKVNMPNVDQERLIDKYINGKRSSAINTYVLSMSSDKDSLILWNNYAKNDGYNIGIQINTTNGVINITDLKVNTTNKVAIVNGKVLYSENDQVKLMNCLLTSYYQVYSYMLDKSLTSPEAHNILNQQWRLIELYSSLLKSELHQNENEYRIVINIQDKSQGIKFRSRNGLVLPYIEVSLTNPTLFKEITIGPKIDDKVAQNVLDFYLNTINRSDIVTQSSSLKLRF